MSSSEPESDPEDQPQKSKKSPAEHSDSDEPDAKKQKSEAAPEPAEPSTACREAIAYLQAFGYDGWKFKKVRQTWLLQHIYDKTQLEDKHFPMLLKYLAGLKGVSRTKTLEEAQAIVKTHEEDEDGPVAKEDSKHERAMQIVGAVSYTHLRAHETVLDLVCRLLLEPTPLRHLCVHATLHISYEDSTF
eukprot:TRINITY_DN12021_c0_g1_i1.p1 TRINITY_DN12021_c0_g1~~TRINITY_DN12021_c0_g1_i1.p1  ORF type:complete len:188 (+),score=39.62 TRINITY_DN12021_c0_g1_i1:195-758(+)